MAKKFKIPIVPATTSKSIRFPNDIIKKVEEAIKGKESNFTAFVVEAVRIALENLEDEKKENVSYDIKNQKNND